MKISQREDSAMISLYFDLFVKESELPLLSTFLFKRATLDIYIYNSFYKISS